MSQARMARIRSCWQVLSPGTFASPVIGVHGYLFGGYRRFFVQVLRIIGGGLWKGG